LQISCNKPAAFNLDSPLTAVPRDHHVHLVWLFSPIAYLTTGVSFIRLHGYTR
jgi:hypothetical protein